MLLVWGCGTAVLSARRVFAQDLTTESFLSNIYAMLLRLGFTICFWVMF